MGIKKSNIAAVIITFLLVGCNTSSSASSSSPGIVVGISSVPKALSDKYTKALRFDRYTSVIAPNGQPIHIIAQDQLSNNQIVRARSVLAHYLTNYTSSKYGSDKSSVANKMAGNGATLLLLNGSDDGKNPAAELDGQPLYQNEIQVEGDEWYIKQDYKHRDATFEEILHMVHDTGIGVDQNEEFIGSLPAYQNDIRSAQVGAMTDDIWGLGNDNKDWIVELTTENSLSQEYLAAAIDSYYGLWGAWKKKDLNSGGMWGIYLAKTRADIKTKDPLGAALIGDFFHPYLTYNARIDGSFDGTFSLRYNELKPYTNHSRYLKDVSLTGNKNTNVVVNELDNNITGNSGSNTVIFSGDVGNYTITKLSGNSYLVEDHRDSGDGKVTLQKIESLKFNNAIEKL
ncbi:Putative lipoprotein [Moritella viscosa]|uniref:hypothetical protein n=2 Tax=Moritella viscosa TaxID=80854 RepID=UPI000508F892|nr:hypothetical protein [Moritella viscosa]CED60394.1 putative lipoprotein [Moritella viscosa]SHO13571.1 Putative lipoprotein [Moritella viscosa]SHO23356.1 Putative lipoprotein [Moritella viscosa]